MWELLQIKVLQPNSENVGTNTVEILQLKSKNVGTNTQVEILQLKSKNVGTNTQVEILQLKSKNVGTNTTSWQLKLSRSFFQKRVHSFFGLTAIKTGAKRLFFDRNPFL